MNVGGHSRIAQGADKDGIEIALQHGESVGGNGGSISQVAVGRPVKGGEIDRGARGFDDFERRGDDFFADTVAGYHSDTFVCHKSGIYQCFTTETRRRGEKLKLTAD